MWKRIHQVSPKPRLMKKIKIIINSKILIFALQFATKLAGYSIVAFISSATPSHCHHLSIQNTHIRLKFFVVYLINYSSCNLQVLNTGISVFMESLHLVSYKCKSLIAYEKLRQLPNNQQKSLIFQSGKPVYQVKHSEIAQPTYPVTDRSAA